METHKSDDNAICRRQVLRFTCRIDSLVCENSLLNLTLPPFLLSMRLSKSAVYLISVDVTVPFPFLDIRLLLYLPAWDSFVLSHSFKIILVIFSYIKTMKKQEKRKKFYKINKRL